MITFGGRPLNTYKGGSNKPVVKVNPASLTIEPPGLDPNVVKVNPASLTIEPPGLFDKNVVKVSPNSLTIEPPGLDPNNSVVDNPGLFDQTKSPEIEYPEINKIISGGNSKTLLKLQAALDKAKFNSLFFVRLLGAPIVIFFIGLWMLCGYLYNLIILMIVFSLFYFLYEITQGILTAGHSLLDGVSKALTTINDAAIEFHIEGLFDFKQQIFGNAFAPWIRDVDRANNKFPRKAGDLAVNILTEMLKSIVKTLPGMIEGVVKGAGKVFSGR